MLAALRVETVPAGGPCEKIRTSQSGPTGMLAGEAPRGRALPGKVNNGKRFAHAIGGSLERHWQFVISGVSIPNSQAWFLHAICWLSRASLMKEPGTRFGLRRQTSIRYRKSANSVSRPDRTGLPEIADLGSNASASAKSRARASRQWGHAPRRGNRADPHPTNDGAASPRRRHADESLNLPAKLRRALPRLAGL
jgi:hypothetical protein